MGRVLRFLANDREISAEAWPGTPALDYIRRDLGLTGAKEGCREGDCGACAVLVGERVASSKSGAAYRAQPSCLLALGELEGRHLVTIEGLASGAREAGVSGGLTPVMRAILEANGSQCGFCSPGFVISLTGFLLEGPPFTLERGIAAVEGNLCRCTGYGAIKRAIAILVLEFADLPSGYVERLETLTRRGVVPASLGAFSRGELLSGTTGSVSALDRVEPAFVLGGGSDFYVRNPDPPPREASPLILTREDDLRVVKKTVGALELGAALSWRAFFADPAVRAAAPGIERFEAELASPLVRERATLGGNAANASPIGDMTALLLALGARVRITRTPGGPARELPLERLFLGYKRLDLAPGEILSAFILPFGEPVLLNFEKVAKRARLDIASVNSAAAFTVKDDRITRARVSAGGVAPTPLLLADTSAFIEGRSPDAGTAREAARIAASEISPIGDIRGSAEYRRVLLGRLVIAHFERLFPGRGIAKGAVA
jgi:xanthine dehydrogenase small subunit